MALAFAVAASANLPALLYSLFWKRFNTPARSGHLRRPDHGRAAGVLLSGRLRDAHLDVPERRLRLVPAAQPGLISIPFGFLCGIVGTLISKETHSAERYDELSVRALTGAGAEKAVVH